MMAPGFDIDAAIPPDLIDDKNGTSMAAPHVAGAWAVLKATNPALTVVQIRDALVNTGQNVTDNRTGGSITKQRINLYNALCNLITCDADDYRFVAINTTVNGTISPANDRDHYFFQATSGSRLTLQLNTTSGALDP